MSPLRGVRWSALLVLSGSLVAATVTWLADAAKADILFDQTSPLLERPSDPLSRSPRLVGMGGLKYVLDDVHHRITMWDLGADPIGIIDVDTASTLEFGPVTSAASSVGDVFGASPAQERQTFGARDFRTYYEGWRRSTNNTYGLVGDWTFTRSDVPFSDDVEVRNKIARPNLTAILAGRLPMVKTDRLQYAIRGILATPRSEDRYLQFVSNASGDFIDLDGTQIDPPNYFVPEEIQGRTTGIGLHFGWRATKATQVSLGYDFVNNELKGENKGFRNASEVGEERPYRIVQGALVGRTGDVEWGADGKIWRSSSDQTWVFTTSAGTAVDPLTGRGKLLERDEEGSTLNARARWKAGKLEIGGGLTTSYRQLELTPPALTDVSSFNHFLNTVFLRNGADTLALTDSIVHNTVEDRSFEGGAGAGYQLGAHGQLAGEVRVFRTLRGQALTGLGPKRVGVDIRGGYEHVLDAVILRVGYGYRTEDLDDFTQHNEFKTHLGTIGLGFKPPGAKWALDAGYSYEWVLPDFEDPTDPRSSRQLLSTRLRWVF